MAYSIYLFLAASAAVRTTLSTMSGWEGIGTWRLAASVTVAPMRFDTDCWRPGCRVWWIGVALDARPARKVNPASYAVSA